MWAVANNRSSNLNNLESNTKVYQLNNVYNIIIACLFVFFLTISITLSLYWYSGTQLTCQVNSCLNSDFGSILNLSSPLLNQTICSNDNCPKSDVITCYLNNGHLVLERSYNIDIIISTMVFFGCAFSSFLLLILVYLLLSKP